MAATRAMSQGLERKRGGKEPCFRPCRKKLVRDTLETRVN